MDVDGGIEKANAILDAAGYARGDDGIRFKMVHDLTPYGEDWRRAGEYMKQALGDIGIDLELRYEDVPTWLKRVYADYDFRMNVKLKSDRAGGKKVFTIVRSNLMFCFLCFSEWKLLSVEMLKCFQIIKRNI